MTDPLQMAADLGVDTFDSSAPCGCGSCQDAFNVALAQYAKMLENDCPLWRERVIDTMAMLVRAENAGRAFAAAGTPPSISLDQDTFAAEMKSWDVPKALQMLAVLSALEHNCNTTQAVMADVLKDNTPAVVKLFRCIEVPKTH